MPNGEFMPYGHFMSKMPRKSMNKPMVQKSKNDMHYMPPNHFMPDGTFMHFGHLMHNVNAGKKLSGLIEIIFIPISVFLSKRWIEECE